jgi:hypothetical protein
MKSEEIQKLLYEHSKNCSRYEVNFVLSHADTMACFCALPITFHSAIAVTDTDFVPLIVLETDAYAHACGISDSGKYAIFQLAYSSGQDSGCTYFIDVSNRATIWKKHISSKWKSITSYHIDESQMIIYEHHDMDNFVVKYSFDGEVIANE